MISPTPGASERKYFMTNKQQYQPHICIWQASLNYGTATVKSLIQTPHLYVHFCHPLSYGSWAALSSALEGLRLLTVGHKWLLLTGTVKDRQKVASKKLSYRTWRRDVNSRGSRVIGLQIFQLPESPKPVQTGWSHPCAQLPFAKPFVAQAQSSALLTAQATSTQDLPDHSNKVHYRLERVTSEK